MNSAASNHCAASANESGKGWFSTTHWSVVLEAGNEHSPKAADALEKLCRTYWKPLHSYVRWQGYTADEAQDLTQSFFAHLLEKNHFNTVHPRKGKFRSFLLTALNHFLINHREKANAAKRGGGQRPISLDDDSADDRCDVKADSGLSPDKAFERQWALAVLDQAFAQLKAEFIAAGKLAIFNELKGFLSADAQSGEYADIAARLNLSAAAVPVAVHRLRQRYREVVRDEIAHTVTNPQEIDEEMRYLLAVIRG